MDSKKVRNSILQLVKDIATVLMRHEGKNYCLAQVSPLLWCHFSYNVSHGNSANFIIVPSPAFNRFIINREYLKVVDKFPNNFGKNDDRLIVQAIKKYDVRLLLRNYSDEEYLEYIRNETMAYIFKVEDDDSISKQILRLDLCRGINDSNQFQGGIFHVFKHFTVNGYSTISSSNQEFLVESWHEIFKYIIFNFFFGDIDSEKKNRYIAKYRLEDGHVLRGVYYKENDIPVSFINSLRIDTSK